MSFEISSKFFSIALVLPVMFTFTLEVFGQSSQLSKTLPEIDTLLSVPPADTQNIAEQIKQNFQLKTTSTRRKLKGLIGIEVQCINGTDRALLIDGTEAVLLQNSSRKKCASLKEIELGISAPDGPRHRYFKDMQEAVVAFGSIGFAPSINDEIQNNRSVPERYGIDQERRENELVRLEKRVLYPGEKAIAFVYFKGKIPLSGVSIEIPVEDLNNQAEKAQVSTSL